MNIQDGGNTQVNMSGWSIKNLLKDNKLFQVAQSK